MCLAARGCGHGGGGERRARRKHDGAELDAGQHDAWQSCKQYKVPFANALWKLEHGAHRYSSNYVISGADVAKLFSMQNERKPTVYITLLLDYVTCNTSSPD